MLHISRPSPFTPVMINNGTTYRETMSSIKALKHLYKITPELFIFSTAEVKSFDGLVKY